MNAEVELIKTTIKKAINPIEQWRHEGVDFAAVNWEVFKELVLYHELTPFAYLVIKDYNSFLPGNLLEFLKQCYYCELVHCEHLWRKFLLIQDAFQQAQTVMVPLKGIALLADVYTQRPLRSMVDIDLLVREENIQKAEEILYDLGYRKELFGLKEKYWRKSQCHIVFRKEGKEGKEGLIELHWSLDFKRKHRTILPALWKRIIEVNVENRTMQLLSCEDTFFSLALHQRRFGKPLCFKNVLDAILLLHKYATHFDWDYVVKESRTGEMCSTTFFLLAQIKFLTEIAIPKLVIEDLDIPLWKRRLIQRFIEKNTFLPSLNLKIKDLYLKSHFLLYDSLWEPTEYILNIPKEQFANYFSLDIDAKRTDFFYRNRLFYIPLKVIFNLISKTK